MRTRTLILLALSLLVAAASASAKGPAPGVASGGRGVTAPSGAFRYVTTRAGDATTIRVVRVRDGKVLRRGSIAGAYGVPVVAADGSTSGVSADGGTLVLASLDGASPNRFALVSTRSLSLRHTIDLPGSFSFDAVSPDGEIVYLIEYLNEVHYRVRAYDVAAGRLFTQVVVDKREIGEPMEGYPVTRATSRDGEWAYTLYGRQGGTAFVHALATEYRTAICIDLPWKADRRTLMRVRMSISRDGTQLVLATPTARLAVVNRHDHTLRVLRAP